MTESLSVKNLLLVYHSQSGNTAQLAAAIAEGVALESHVQLRIKLALETDVRDLQWADGLLLGTPENLGYMSGGIKDFFDRTYYPAQTLQLCIPYALFVSAGNDGSGAVREIDRIMLGYPMKKVAEPIIIKGDISPLALQRCKDLGQTMAAALVMGLF